MRRKRSTVFLGLTILTLYEPSVCFGGGFFLPLSGKLGVAFEYTFIPIADTYPIRRELSELYPGNNVRINGNILNMDLVYQFTDLAEGLTPYLGGGVGQLGYTQR